MSPSANPITTTGLSREPLVRPSMPELDTLRGIAVLSVLVYHAFFWSNGSSGFHGVARVWMSATSMGWLGVNLFFVLSGFLITGILLESRSKPLYYRRFYTRRALRILPAYYSLLLILALLHQVSAAFLGLSFVYLSNVTNLFGVWMAYGPLWSLAVEEHYYFLWPAIVRKLRVRQLVCILALICVSVPALRAIAFHYGYTWGLSFYTWFVADGLAIGSLVAVLMRTSVTRKQVATVSILLMGSATAAVSAGYPFGILTRLRQLGAGLQYTVANVLFTGVLLLFLLVGTGPHKRWVNSSVLRFFGYISYGLYLIQMVIFTVYDRLIVRYRPALQPSDGHFALVVLRFAVAGAAAILVSYLSRKYYEEQFLRLKDRVVPPLSKTIRRGSLITAVTSGPSMEAVAADGDRVQTA